MWYVTNELTTKRDDKLHYFDTKFSFRVDAQGEFVNEFIPSDDERKDKIVLATYLFTHATIRGNI